MTFYEIQTFDVQATSLESHDADEFLLHALTTGDRRVALVLSRTQLEALAKQIADAKPR